MDKSRIAGFYKLSLEERLNTLQERGVLNADDVAYLTNRRGGLSFETADNMIENAIGVLELPLGLGLNFSIADKDYIVPMSVEEPSVLAAVSHIAKLVRDCDGFKVDLDEPIMIGQIQVVDVPDPSAAIVAITKAVPGLLKAANACDPKLVSFGGGARSIEVRQFESPRPMLVVHVYVDCRDAMGANLINTMVEALAPQIEDLTGGRVFLRILSNLADRRLARASCRIPFEKLAWHGFSGEDVAEGVSIASDFASADPYRATTHNKGIMNGISSVCIATGNDWRAIESGAHAYAAQGGQYSPLATWRIEDGALVGEIELPIAVGIVGGTLKVHPTVQLAHKIIDVKSAQELAGVMASVGLAQNLAALKALATEGIQRGHMALHARSVAIAAGATENELELLVQQLKAGGEIRVDVAEQLLADIRKG